MRLIISLLALLAFAAPARADFAAGVAAYDRGDYRAAYEEWLPLARKGDLAAQRNVGHLYRSGQGVEQDFAEAAEWYRRAAESGLAAAQVNLGTMYLRGQGVNEDAVEAARWFELAARQGHPIAQYNLGAMHLKGLGVPESEARALGWLNLSARQGHRPAIELLSEFVQRPQPAEAEPRPASALAAAPAPQPEPPRPPAAAPRASADPAAESTDISLGEVGDFVSRAFGGLLAGGSAPKPAEPAVRERLATGVVALHAGNFAVAREKLEPLARAGDAEAQHQLGLLHARADYAEADPAQAWAWFDLAARQGREDAAEARRRLEPRLSEAQRDEARRLAENLASR
jgi:TPR repeat protein